MMATLYTVMSVGFICFRLLQFSFCKTTRNYFALHLAVEVNVNDLKGDLLQVIRHEHLYFLQGVVNSVRLQTLHNLYLPYFFLKISNQKFILPFTLILLQLYLNTALDRFRISPLLALSLQAKLIHYTINERPLPLQAGTSNLP